MGSAVMYEGLSQLCDIMLHMAVLQRSYCVADNIVLLVSWNSLLIQLQTGLLQQWTGGHYLE